MEGDRPHGGDEMSVKIYGRTRSDAEVAQLSQCNVLSYSHAE